MNESSKEAHKSKNFLLKYSIVDDKNKVVEITFGDETFRFQLRVKRGFEVLVALLRAYPNYMNIHDLDSIFNDPNRALSSLRLEDGFEPFIETKSVRNVTHAKINLYRLFNLINKESDVITLAPSDNRTTISDEMQKTLFEKFKGKCNITGFKLSIEVKQKHTFLKNHLIATYDHRQPLSKGGDNQEHNFQLISRAANQEKNRICSVCIEPKCSICALAHPEKVARILPTGQDISSLR
ncbi:MAG: hypothetical protein OXO49_01160 [Gammaproteobacteria bacterium]|nr:hypothetical protein [Gammaproteobacteria bacterium]MDE0252888.1 hypothetical protein [Gammaproteobacteria bacterium]MDE0402099.1 hypothetical protein [Gammaproteobacteria bacterium]